MEDTDNAPPARRRKPDAAAMPDVDPNPPLVESPTGGNFTGDQHQDDEADADEEGDGKQTLTSEDAAPLAEVLATKPASFTAPFSVDGVSVRDADKRAVCIVASPHMTLTDRQGAAAWIAEKLNAE